MIQDKSSVGVALNPFAPPISDTTVRADALEAPNKLLSLSVCLQRLAIWTTICILSAGPSFAWGMATIGGTQLLAMGTGILIFILVYTLCDILTFNSDWRKDRRIRTTLRIGYVSRMVISVIFPVGGVMDMFCGMIAIRLVMIILPSVDSTAAQDFGPVLAVTLVQGLLLNVVLFAFMSLIHLIQLAAFRERRPSDVAE